MTKNILINKTMDYHDACASDISCLIHALDADLQTPNSLAYLLKQQIPEVEISSVIYSQLRKPPCSRVSQKWDTAAIQDGVETFIDGWLDSLDLRESTSRYEFIHKMLNSSSSFR